MASDDYGQMDVVDEDEEEYEEERELFPDSQGSPAYGNGTDSGDALPDWDDGQSTYSSEINAEGGGDGGGHDNSHVVDARNMGDFDERFMGKSIHSKPPVFEQGKSGNSTWQQYNEVDETTRSIRPKRSMCWHIPVELFSRDGTRFRHWATPNKNDKRAIEIATMIGMAFTPTSKGFL